MCCKIQDLLELQDVTKLSENLGKKFQKGMMVNKTISESKPDRFVQNIIDI